MGFMIFTLVIVLVLLVPDILESVWWLAVALVAGLFLLSAVPFHIIFTPVKSFRWVCLLVKGEL